MIEPILYTYNARLERIIDADTIILRLDRGFKDYSVKTIRLARIDAEEVRGEGKAEGLAAKKWVENLLSQYEKLTIESKKLDSFGRSIAEVWYWQGEKWVNLNDELVRQGWAKKVTGNR